VEGCCARDAEHCGFIKEGESSSSWNNICIYFTMLVRRSASLLQPLHLQRNISIIHFRISSNAARLNSKENAIVLYNVRCCLTNVPDDKLARIIDFESEKLD